MSGSPVKQVRTVCPYCGVGCGMILEARDGRITKVIGDKEHPANFGRLCTKGLTCAEAVTAPGRLASAYVRENRTAPLQRLTVGAAAAEVAVRLKRIIAKHGPDSVALYTSGQLSLESQYLANKLFKGFLRTNNIDSNSRLCMSSAASGYKLSLGADGPPGSYQDIDLANCFLAIGANMADCHPILFTRVLDRRRAGAKLIVVDPRRNETAEKADLYLQIKPGTDLAFLNGLLYLLIENGRIDEAFIARHTTGWNELHDFLKEYPPAAVAAATGLPEADIRLAAKWIGEAAEFTSFWTMGLNQSTHGTWHTNAICNLHLATGKICRPGSGPFSLTGQPNAMGGREVGYLSHSLPGQRVVTSTEDRVFVERLWRLSSGAIRTEPGTDAVEMFKQLESGAIKAVWIIGTNPVASMPNRRRVIAGLERAELVVVQDAYHPTETTRYANILLPGALWAEAEGTMVNSERNVTLMQAAVPPVGEAIADWELIAQVARHLGFSDDFAYKNAGEVFDEIRQAWNPKTGYDLRGMDYEKLRRQSCQWPFAPGHKNGQPIRYVSPANDGSHLGIPKHGIYFPTDSGRAHFFARPALPPAELPDADYPFVLETGRLPHQWHTLTKTGKIATLNKLNPGAFVEIHPEDAAVLGIEPGVPVKVSSRRGFAIYPAQITTRVRPGNCFATFHWNDLFGENLCVNAATSEAVDAISLQPELKFAAVALAKVTLPAGTGESGTDFSTQQKIFLGGFFSDLAQHYPAKSAIVLPENAPFTPDQRKHLNDLLGQLRKPVSESASH